MAFWIVYWRAMKKDNSLYYITLHISTKRAFCLQFPPSPKRIFAILTERELNPAKRAPSRCEEEAARMPPEASGDGLKEHTGCMRLKAVQFPPSPKYHFAILTEQELFILELLLKDIRFDFTCVSVSYGYENYFSESDNKYYLKIY